MQFRSNIKEKLRKLPDKPGVYFMRDQNHRVIYVGKAVSLRKRVQSYFRKATLRSADPKLRGLIKSVADLDYLVVATEAEAILTEGRLIKEYRPRYNVSFRDDKRFLLLRIHLSDPFPRFTLERIKKKDGALYFGPYASAASARETQKFVEKRFGIRQCRARIPSEQQYKHCINDIVRYCSAPCVGKVSQERYLQRVEQACAFLRGDKREILQDLEEEMKQAAQREEFERASALRDTLFKVREVIRQRAKGSTSLAIKEENARAGIDELRSVLNLVVRPFCD